MGSYYLAVDIGASSGRHILGSVENGKIKLQEIYRFENKLVKKNNHLCWDLDKLFAEIVNGMKKCKELDKIPVSMGIDTWAVDFVLLDKNNAVIGDTVAYRDARTKGMDKFVEAHISNEQLYTKTGIQKQPFNSIYQLCAIKKEHPEQLECAKSFLMVPEYFNFLLTGVKKNEYTNATTTQLVDAQTHTWDFELIDKLQLNAEMFGEIYPPKTAVGHLNASIRGQVGFDCEVVLPATHDTGSAVMAVPTNAENDSIYLSSGTWSLMGMERMNPDCSEQSRKLNFTNEGGYDYRFRYLKNIMGLWIIQSVRHELEHTYSFDELCNMARQASDFHSLIDVNDESFLSPENMTEAIKTFCKESSQQVPQSIGELFACIYHSLAKSYADAVRELEQTTGHTYSYVHIIGGGSKDDYLNTLTAQYTGKTVFAGPSEATATGNLLAQMLKDGVFADLPQAREAVANSFDIQKFI
jgi:rhamnulokinase